MNRSKHIRFDWAIKNILGDKANFGILEGFLSELLKEDVKILEVLGNEDNKESVGDKYNRVDIFVKGKDSKDNLIIVGIQNRKEADYYYKYYDIFGNISGSTSEPVKRSFPYREIKKMVVVSVVYFDLGEGEDYVYYGGSLLNGPKRFYRRTGSLFKYHKSKEQANLFP